MATPASARTWARQGDQRSLAVRWQEASARLIRLGGIVAWAMSETAYDDMLDEIARLSPAVREDDPALVAARAELGSASNRYWRAHQDILANQKRLARSAATEEHRLLGLITREMLAPPPTTQQMLNTLFPHQHRADRSPVGINDPLFASVSETRQAALAIAQQAQILEGTLAQQAEALHFEVMPSEAQNRRLIVAMAQRLNALAERFNERLSALEQKSTSKQRRSK